MYVPFLFVPALHIAPPRGAPASQPDCQKCPPSMPALTPARGSGIFVSDFPFYPFPRQALNRYQLPFSWHRWLKTASAHVLARRAWRVRDEPSSDSARVCSSPQRTHTFPFSYRSWMEDACCAMGDRPD